MAESLNPKALAKWHAVSVRQNSPEFSGSFAPAYISLFPHPCFWEPALQDPLFALCLSSASSLALETAGNLFKCRGFGVNICRLVHCLLGGPFSPKRILFPQVFSHALLTTSSFSMYKLGKPETYYYIWKNI